MSETDNFAAVGLVLAVIPNKQGFLAFTEYDVKFIFGSVRLYATQLVAEDSALGILLLPEREEFGRYPEETARKTLPDSEPGY